MSELHSLVHLDLCCEPEEDLAPSYGVPYTVHRDPGRFTCVLPAADFSILDNADNEVHALRRIGSVLCLERKGPSAPVGRWGFLRSLAGRHRLPPHPWPRHRTNRFDAPRDPHSIVVSWIARSAAETHTMSRRRSCSTTPLAKKSRRWGHRYCTLTHDRDCCAPS